MKICFSWTGSFWFFHLKCEKFSSVQFSRSIVSDSLRPHGLQHARPPCPSPTPRVYPNLCPLSQWCHPTISSSVVKIMVYSTLIFQYEAVWLECKEHWLGSLKAPRFIKTAMPPTSCGSSSTFLNLCKPSLFIYKIRLLSLIFPVFQVSCRGTPLP